MFWQENLFTRLFICVRQELPKLQHCHSLGKFMASHHLRALERPAEHSYLPEEFSLSLAAGIILLDSNEIDCETRNLRFHQSQRSQLDLEARGSEPFSVELIYICVRNKMKKKSPRH